MNKTASLIRISILIALCIVAFIGIFSEPMEDSSTWFTDFFLAKGMGLAAIYAMARLYSRWRKSDPWLAWYHQWSVKGCDQ